MALNRLNFRGTVSGGRLVKAVAAAALVLIHGVAAFADQPSTDLTVREERGVYTVSARFLTDQPAAIALNVLTDYEAIPRFFPDVRTSIVRERTEGRVVVEQEVTSGLMMFAKRVHLILEIQEQSDALTFRDRCGKSFERYEGSWHVSQENGRTVIVYELVAAPAFDVPAWMVKRLLRRDSAQMIERLQREIAARASSPSSRTDPNR